MSDRPLNIDETYIAGKKKWAEYEARICQYVRKNSFDLGIDDPAKFIVGYLIDDMYRDDGNVFEVKSYMEYPNLNSEALKTVLKINQETLIERLSNKLEESRELYIPQNLREDLKAYLKKLRETEWENLDVILAFEVEWNAIVESVKFLVNKSGVVKDAVDYVNDVIGEGEPRFPGALPSRLTRRQLVQNALDKEIK